MKKWKRYLSLRRSVVALAAVAVAVPVAQANAQAMHNPGFNQPTAGQRAKLLYGIPASSYRRLPADDQSHRDGDEDAHVRNRSSRPTGRADTGSWLRKRRRSSATARALP